MKYILFRCVFSVFIVYNCVYLWWSIHLWSQFVCLIIDCVISFIPFCRRCWIIYPRRWVHLWGLLIFSEWKLGKELQGKTSTFLDVFKLRNFVISLVSFQLCSLLFHDWSPPMSSITNEKKLWIKFFFMSDNLADFTFD